MNYADFDFYGYVIRITLDSFDENDLVILSEFSFFKKLGQPHRPNCIITLSQNPVNQGHKKGIYLFSTKMGQVRQLNWRRRQICYFQNGHLRAIAEDQTFNNQRSLSIHSSQVELVNEILYYLMMSVCGEYFDKKGLMRLHAASFWMESNSVLAWGHPKAGKSTLSRYFMDQQSVFIYSDELSLLSLEDKKLYPFPNHISIADTTDIQSQTIFPKKKKIALPEEKIAPIFPLSKIFWLQKGSESKSRSITKFKILAFYMNIFLGRGLIQMAEYLLRFDNVGGLFKISINRLKLIFKIRTLLIEEIFHDKDQNKNLIFLKRAFFPGKFDNDNVAEVK